jgi:uncharacterized protein with PIN domain
MIQALDRWVFRSSTNVTSDVKFIADVMVGKSPMASCPGVDVIYSNSYEDDEIIRIATAENRVVLTRDTSWPPARRRSGPC